MKLIVSIPDDLASRFGSEAELGRRVVEALALQEYRAGRLTESELCQLLGFATPAELDRFLDEHDASQGVQSHRLDQVNDIVAGFQAFAAGHTIGDLKIADLISEGRR